MFSTSVCQFPTPVHLVTSPHTLLLTHKNNDAVMPKIYYTRFPEAPRRQGTCQLISSLLFWGQPVETDTCMYVCMYVERHKPQVCFQSESPLTINSIHSTSHYHHHHHHQFIYSTNNKISNNNKPIQLQQS